MPDDYTEPVDDTVQTLLRPAGRGVDTNALVRRVPHSPPRSLLLRP